MISKLRRVGEATMLPVPAELLTMLHLHAGDTLAMTVEDGRLIAELRQWPRYTMAELLAASGYSEPQPDQECEWVDAGVAGREML